MTLRPIAPAHVMHRCRFVLVTIALMLMPWTNVFGQPGTTYAFTASNTAYAPLAGGTVLLSGASLNDQVFAVQLPANFWYCGTWYGSMHVSSNGFIAFGAPMSAANSTPLSSPEAYAGAIAPFGCDLQASSSSSEVRWQRLGNELVIQWSAVQRAFAGNTESLSFQARLNLLTGAIRFVYGGVTGLHASTSAQPQVGLRGTSNSYPMQVNNRRVGTGAESWASPLSGTGNASALRFTATAPARSPASGQTYTFTPPAPCIPTVSISASPAVVRCIGTPITFSCTTTNAGSAPQYAWSVNGSPVGTGSTFTSAALSHGDVVTLVLTSSAGCASGATATALRTVDLSNVLMAQAQATSAIPCNGGTTTVVVTASGGTGTLAGTGPYTRPAGTSTFTVTDGAGCITTASITLTQPTAVQAVATVLSPESGCNTHDATVMVAATGGTPPYAGAGQQMGYAAGPVSFTVVDANGCAGSTGLTIPAPDTDADGLNDCVDPCPSNPDNGDDDGDGTLNCLDGCPLDAMKTSPGNCGCGQPEPGAACNDGNASTVNDVIGANCQCTGTFIGPCIQTTLIATPGPTLSCGAVGKRVLGPGHAGRLYAKPAVRMMDGQKQPATMYGFELVNTTTRYTRYAWSNTYCLVLGGWSSDPLLCGTHTYEVRVNVSFNGGANWCGWGPACTVEITNQRPVPGCTPPQQVTTVDLRSFTEEMAEDMAAEPPVLQLWPNPNAGDELHVAMEGLVTEEEQAQLTITDLQGRAIDHRRIGLIGTSINERIHLPRTPAPGIYLVNVVVGDLSITERLVIQ